MGEIADCDGVDVPDGAEAVCRRTPRDDRERHIYHLVDRRSPAVRAFGRMSPDPERQERSNRVLRRFASAVIRERPLEYTRIVARDLAFYFVPGRESRYGTDSAMELPDNGGSNVLRSYASVFHTPRWLMALLLLLPLRDPPAQRQRGRDPARLGGHVGLRAALPDSDGAADRGRRDGRRAGDHQMIWSGTSDSEGLVGTVAQQAQSATWRRVFESAAGEHDYPVDEIEGTLPRELRGTLYRNGPGRLDVRGRPASHLFDGDGMIAQFTIADGQVRYRNRFVRTEHYLGERDGPSPRFRGFGKQRRGGPLGNAFRSPGNTANTSVVYHAGSLLALWEGGHPWRVDPDTLDTLGEHDFGGSLPRAYFFSAHPKHDRATGELFNFGMEYGRRTRLRCYRVDRDGRLHHLAAVPLPKPVLNHDFALTERHLVFVIDPLVLRPLRFVLGFTSLAGALRFEPGTATRIVLVPRDGGAPRVTECDPFFHFHVANAFEEGDDTVVDLVRYPDFAVSDPLRDFHSGPWGELGVLSRLRVSRTGAVETHAISGLRGEFPQHDTRRTGRSHRYAYMIGSDSDMRTAVVKLDTATGAAAAHELGAGEVAGEAIFVPRAAASGEDDGWLLSVVYSGAEHRSRLLVLDARDPEAEPLAAAHLRHHVPFGFHGTFVDRVAEPGPAPRLTPRGRR